MNNFELIKAAEIQKIQKQIKSDTNPRPENIKMELEKADNLFAEIYEDLEVETKKRYDQLKTEYENTILDIEQALIELKSHVLKNQEDLKLVGENNTIFVERLTNLAVQYQKATNTRRQS